MKRAMKECKYAGCAGLTTARYCDQHQKIVSRTQEQDSKHRDAELQRFYHSRPWKQTRKDFLYDHPFCACTRPACQVHHVKDAFDHPELRLEWSNLQQTCASCHSRETARRNRAKGKCW